MWNRLQVTPKLATNAETEKEKVLVREWGWVIRCFHRGVGRGHPPGAEDGPEVKAGAGAPILARREGLGQLPDRARHRRRNQNLKRKPDQRSEIEKKRSTLLAGPATEQQDSS